MIRKFINRSFEIQNLSALVCVHSNVILDNLLLDSFAENIELLSKSGVKFTILHAFQNLLEEDVINSEFTNNLAHLRFANEKTSNLFEMIISSQLGNKIVSKLCSLGLQAIGFSGKDGNLIISKKSSYIQIDNIYMSEPLIINPEILFALDETKIIPIISPVALSQSGKTMILEPDYTSGMLASAINASMLIMMCENDFLINQVGMVSSVQELDSLLERNFEISSDDPIIKASRYTLLHSETSVFYIDSNKIDSLLMCIYG